MFSFKFRLTEKTKKNLKYLLNYLIEVIIPIIPYCYIIISALRSLVQVDDLRLAIAFQEFEKNVDAKLFSTTKIEMLTTISVVLIGFYITVMSVFGTSYSKSIIEISGANLGKKFIRYSSLSLGYAFLFLVTAVMYDVFSFTFKSGLLFFLLIAMLTNCARYTIIVMLMYSTNISSAKQNSDICDNQNKEIISLLHKISSSISVNNITNNQEYIEKLKEKLKQQEDNAPHIPNKQI